MLESSQIALPRGYQNAMTFRTIQRETRPVMIGIGGGGICLKMAAVTVKRSLDVIAAFMADLAVQKRVSAYQRKPAFLMHLPETRFIHPVFWVMAAIAGIPELVLMHVLMATGTARICIGKLQRKVTGAATHGLVPSNQWKSCFGVVKLGVRTHRCPVLGNMADLAVELDRAMGILAGLALQRERAGHKSQKQDNQHKTDPPVRSVPC